MPRVMTKQKGNRFDKADYHIPYFTTTFFNPGKEDKDNEDGKESSKGHTVKLLSNPFTPEKFQMTYKLSE